MEMDHVVAAGAEEASQDAPMRKGAACLLLGDEVKDAQTAAEATPPNPGVVAIARRRRG